MAIIRSVRGFTPKMGEGCFLADNAAIIGDVTMGNECSIWFGTVLRGDVYGGNAKALRLYEREGLKKVGAFRQEWGWAYPFYGLEKRL